MPYYIDNETTKQVVQWEIYRKQIRSRPLMREHAFIFKIRVSENTSGDNRFRKLIVRIKKSRSRWYSRILPVYG